MKYLMLDKSRAPCLTKSNNLPGHPITILGGYYFKDFLWTSTEVAPPKKASAQKGRNLENLLNSSLTCWANSLVGQMIKACKGLGFSFSN